MAQPLSFRPSPRDRAAQLAARLERAPAEHAEALLAACDVVQALHDRGVLELLRGVLGSGDAVVAIAVDAARTPTSTRALRNLLLLVDALGAIDPAQLADVTRAVPVALTRSHADAARPPGMRRLLGTFMDADFRRGLAALTALCTAFGQNLAARTPA